MMDHAIAFRTISVFFSVFLFGNVVLSSQPNFNNVNNGFLFYDQIEDEANWNEQAWQFIEEIQKLKACFEKKIDVQFRFGETESTKKTILDRSDQGGYCAHLINTLSRAQELLVTAYHLDREVAYRLNYWVEVGKDTLSNWLKNLSDVGTHRLLWCLVYPISDGEIRNIAKDLAANHLYQTERSVWRMYASFYLADLPVYYKNKICDLFRIIKTEIPIKVYELFSQNDKMLVLINHQNNRLNGK